MDSCIYQREVLAQCMEKCEIIDGEEVPDPISVLDFKKNSQSAEEFEALAREVMEKMGVIQ